MSMQESVLYIVLVLLCVVIYLLLNQKRNKEDDKSNEELEQQATVKALKDRLNKAMTPAQIKKAEEIVKELTQNNPKLIQKKQGSHP